MKPSDSASATHRSAAGAAGPPGVPGRLVVFVVLAAVLAARLLIPETAHAATLSFLPESPVGTTPATTVWLDAMLLVAALLARLLTVRRAGRPRVLDAGLLTLLAAVVISTVAAHDRRAAANAGADLFILACAAVSLLRLTQPGWMVRLLLALLLAGGVAGASKCIIQRTSEFPATLEQWQQQKAELVAGGLDPNAPEIINYERRMRSQNAYGYLNHPNVTASILAAAALLGAGLFAGLIRRGRPAGQWIAPALVALAAVGVLLAGLLLTASRGAMVALAAGLLVLVLVIAARGRIARRPGAALGLLVAGYVAVIGTGAAWGLTRGTLPGASLAFRWQYWRAAARAIGDAPLTGIGGDNFRAAFMRYKPPESTEEVEDPHNLWITLLLELGPLGLLAGVLLSTAALRGALVAAAGATAGAAGDRGAARNPDAPATGRPAATLCGVAAAGLVLATWAAATGMPFRVEGDAFGAVLLLWAVFDAGVWLAAYALGWWLLAQASGGRRSCVAAGVLAALAALLVHNLVGFSLLTPAGLAAFGLLAVGGARLHGGETPGPRDDPLQTTATGSGARRLVVAALAGGLVAAHLVLVAIPTARGDALWRRFQAAIRAAQRDDVIVAALARARQALAADAWNAELPRLLGATALELARRPELPPRFRHRYLDQAGALDEIALRRDEMSFAARRLRAEILDALAASDGDQRTLAQAAAAWDEAIRLYPTNPRARIDAGLAWYRLWVKTREPNAARRAAAHLRAALEIDATRLPEVAAKLRRREVRTVREHLDRLLPALEEQTRSGG